MTNAPHACPGPREMLHKAIGAVIASPCWWELSEEQAVGIAMKATGGAANPQAVREEFCALKRERGIT
jgi:hypothetical protein